MGVGNGELSYSVDPTGNRLTRISTLAALGEQTFTDDANDELATDGYDANGNTTSSNGQAAGQGRYEGDFFSILRGRWPLTRPCPETFAGGGSSDARIRT